MAEQIFPKGMHIFPPRENAPDFVKGKISIHLETFTEWAKQHLDQNGRIAFDLKEGREGIYASLDTWKRDVVPEPQVDDGPSPDDIPF